MKRALIPIALLAAALTACSADDSSVSAGPVADPPPATPAAEAGSPLDGSWQVGQPVGRIAAALEAAGLGRWAASVDAVPHAAPGTPYTMDVKIEDGFVLTTGTLDGAPLGVIDRQAVEVDGDRVTFTPQGGTCSTTYRWTLRRSTLTLEPMKDTCPDVNGTPDLAYSTAIYGAAPFQRRS